MNYLKEYKTKEIIKKQIVAILDECYKDKQLSDKSIREMLKELISLYYF